MFKSYHNENKHKSPLYFSPAPQFQNLNTGKQNNISKNYINRNRQAHKKG